MSPRVGEKYYLRLLLTHVPGARDWDDFKNVCQPPAATFRDAATVLGLLEDDLEWDRCLEEAVTYQMPRQLRHLFATILMFNQPQDPFGLWVKHKEHMVQDFEYRLRLGGFVVDPEECNNAALWEIDEILHGGGTGLRLWGCLSF